MKKMVRKTTTFLVVLAILIQAFTLGFVFRDSGLKVSANEETAYVYLSDLEWVSAQCAELPVQKDKNIIGNALNIVGVEYEKGLSMHTYNDSRVGEIVYDISGLGYALFDVLVGIDGAQSYFEHSIEFSVEVDGVVKWNREVFASDGSVRAQADISGASELILRIGNGDGAFDGDWANWVSPMLVRESNYVSSMLWEETRSINVSSGRNRSLWDEPLNIGGQVFASGFGTHANSDIRVNIAAKDYLTFDAWVGPDNQYNGQVQFFVIGWDEANQQEVELASSPVMQGSVSAYHMISLVIGYNLIYLRTICVDTWGNNGGNWGDAKFNINNHPDFYNLADYPYISAFSGLGGSDPVRRNRNISNNPLVTDGTTYQKGYGTHTGPDPLEPADITFDVSALDMDWFDVICGFDSGANVGWEHEIEFEILVDNVSAVRKTLYSTNPAEHLQVNIEGAQTITLRNYCGTDGHPFDSANWCNPIVFKETSYITNMPLYDTTVGVPVAWNRGGNLWDQIFTVGGTEYKNGIGTHANSDMWIHIDPNGGYEIFEALVGVEDLFSYAGGKAEFAAISYDENDAVIASQSVIVGHKTAAVKLILNVKNAVKLQLRALDGGDGSAGDGMNWMEGRLMIPPAQSSFYVSDMLWESSTAGTDNDGLSARRDANIIGNSLTMGGKSYDKGIGTHAFADSTPADIVVDLTDIDHKYFYAEVGIDDSRGSSGTVQFILLGDGQELYRTPILRGIYAPHIMLVNISDCEVITLRVLNGGDGWTDDWANWCDAAVYSSLPAMEPVLLIENFEAYDFVTQGSAAVQGTAMGGDRVEVWVNGTQTDLASLGDSPRFSLDAQGLINGENTVTVKLFKGSEMVDEKNIKLYRVHGSSVTETFETANTLAQLKIFDRYIALSSFVNKDTGVNLLPDICVQPFIHKVTINNTDVPVIWTYHSTANVPLTDGVQKVFTFKSTTPQLTLKSTWTAYTNEKGPIQHKVDILNETGETITVYAQDTFNLTVTGSGEFSMLTTTKGADNPGDNGTYTEALTNGFKKDVYTTAEYNDGRPHDPGYVPFVSMTTEDGNGFITGWEWPHGRIAVSAAVSDGVSSIKIAEGLNSDFTTDIPDGETYIVPSGFIGTYSGDFDDGSNMLNKWLKNHMMPEIVSKDESYPKIAANLVWAVGQSRRNWAAESKNFNRAALEHQLSGVEEICQDIGWWIDDMDFRDIHPKWPEGMAASSQFVHSLGLDFTLYFRFHKGNSINLSDPLAQANSHPEWFVADWNDATIDLGNVNAVAYLKNLIYSKFNEFNLDTFRSDMGPVAYWSERTNRHSNQTDVTYWSARGWYDVIDDMYVRIPDFKWENCSSGGSLKDYASLSRSTKIQATDVYDALSVRRSFYDTVYAVPAMQQLNFMGDFFFDSKNPNDDYRFRSVLFGIPSTLVQSPDEMTVSERASYERALAIYKDWMQPLVRNANLYHVLPRADGVNWDGMQYADPDTGKGVLLVFKPSDTVSDEKTVLLKGLDPEKSYYIHSEDKTIPFGTYTGAFLMETGLTFHLEGEFQSEIVYIEQTDGAEGYQAPETFTTDMAQTENLSNTSPITLAWNASEGAEGYTVTVFEDSLMTLPVLQKTVAKDALSLDIDGLCGNKTYYYKVEAENTFGRTAITGAPLSFSTQGRVYAGYLSDYITLPNSELVLPQQDKNGGLVMTDGALHAKGLRITTKESIFDTTPTVFEAELPQDHNFAILKGTVALDDLGEYSAVTLNIEADNGQSQIITLNHLAPAAKVSINVMDAMKINFTLTNTSPKNITQSFMHLNQDYEYQDQFKFNNMIFGDTAKESYYDFSARVQYKLWGMLSSYPKQGIIAAYVDDNNYAVGHIDKQFNLLATHVVLNGNDLGWQNSNLPTAFDHFDSHTMRAVRNGNSIQFIIDGTSYQTRSISGMPASQVGLINEDVTAEYSNITLSVLGQSKALGWGDAQNGKQVTGKWNGIRASVNFGTLGLINRPSLTSENYLVDNDFVSSVSRGTGVNQFVQSVIVDGGMLRITENGTAVTEGLLKTGQKAEIIDEDGIVLADWEIVVTGDVSGDGIVNAVDLVAMKKHILDIKMLKGAFLKAGSISEKETDQIDITDLVRIKKLIVG